MSAAPRRATSCDVDLDAVAANCSSLAERAGVPLIAVVKGDAYGHGAEAVAEVALESGAALLAVATIEEGLALREAGIAAEILVLLGASDAGDADAALGADLSLAAWDADGLRRIAEAARAAGRTAAVHLKVDTGLVRLGAAPADAPALVALARGLAGLRLDGLYTHLATADERDDATARDQLARFDEVRRAVSPAPRWIHALATAGVAALGPLAGCTAARVGLGIYGIAPAPHLGAALTLRPALTWRSRVLRVAEVPRGTGVAYGHEYRLPRDGRVATVAVGYGDGLPRAAWPRGRVLVPGGLAPIAGRVSMDLTTLDVTDHAEVRAGDAAVLIGSLGGIRQSAVDLGAACGTIAYEIVTGIGPRVPRAYLRGGRVVATKSLAGGFVRC